MAIIYRCENCGREVDPGGKSQNLYGTCEGVPKVPLLAGIHIYEQVTIERSPGPCPGRVDRPAEVGA
jgi:hypothetical protein